MSLVIPAIILAAFVGTTQKAHITPEVPVSDLCERTLYTTQQGIAHMQLMHDTTPEGLKTGKTYMLCIQSLEPFQTED